MTTIRTYRCNLCGDEIEGPFGGSEAGYGIIFTGANPFNLVKVQESENHICFECAECLTELHTEACRTG